MAAAFVAREGEWVRDEPHGDDPGEPTPQPELFLLYEEEPGGKRPSPVLDPRPQAGTAAGRGASCRPCLHGADPGCTCAAGGGPTGGRGQALRQFRSRADYRNAQDLLAIPSSVGGSADCRVSVLLAVRRAER